MSKSGAKSRSRSNHAKVITLRVPARVEGALAPERPAARAVGMQDEGMAALSRLLQEAWAA